MTLILDLGYNRRSGSFMFKLNFLHFNLYLNSQNTEWAIPGGMIDPGEIVSYTLKREFGEEALNTDEHPDRNTF